MLASKELPHHRTSQPVHSEDRILWASSGGAGRGRRNYPLPPPETLATQLLEFCIRDSFFLLSCQLPGSFREGNCLSPKVNERELDVISVCGVGVRKRKVSQMEAGSGGRAGTEKDGGTTFRIDLPLFT